MEVPGVLDASVGYTGREFNSFDEIVVIVDDEEDEEGEDEEQVVEMNNGELLLSKQQPRYRQPVATYRSVCGGDGHTEAVRIVFDPSIVHYEDIVRIFFENPRVPTIYGKQDPQYQVACWAMDDRQRAVAQAAAEAAGKGGVPVYDGRGTMWHEGEDNHQNFFGSKPSSNPGIFDPLSW